MANYYGVARTNYFKVKDLDGLKKALEPFSLKLCGKEGFVALLDDHGDGGGWPNFALTEDGEDIEFDATVHICPFMEDDQVLVIMEAGHEKYRYVNGWAEAYNAKGERVGITLDDIYAKAAEAFGVPVQSISRATY
jgi:hypothetical protein